jgi:uncharacterized protein YdbL (DUF1318 family)
MRGIALKNHQGEDRPNQRQLNQSRFIMWIIEYMVNSVLRHQPKGVFLKGDKVIIVLYWLIVGVVLSACVTVNVYFPAAAAEQAADRIIQDVWREAPEDAETPTPSTLPSPQSQQPAESVHQIAVWESLLNILLRPAQATADININTPGINRLKNTMAARFQRLAKYFSSGAVGLTRDGLLAVRDLNTVPLPERATVNRLVAQDNNDRNALYREIAIANNHPEWESDIRSVFAREWIDNARSGWWYQSPSGWVKK